MENKLTATKVAQYLDISVPTLNNWYKWYNNPKYEKPKDTPELPAYTQQGKRGTRYWDKADLPKLMKFKNGFQEVELVLWEIIMLGSGGKEEKEL